MLKQVIYLNSSLKLNIENGQLRIAPYSDKKEIDPSDIKHRPIEDIGVIIIDSPQIIITSAVISTLMENKIAIISCDNKHLPSGLMLNIAGNTLQSERMYDQLSASLPLKKRLWQQTVCDKIHNQALVLYMETGKRHPRISRLLTQVKSGDTGNIEAKAAAYYWKNLWDKDLEFKRERYGEEPNSLLNYGYAILRSIMARALVASGLHPTLGIFHKNKYNPYCLADDIMEPYRPYVDLLVAEIIKNFDDPTLENREIRKSMLSVPFLDVTLDGKIRPLMVAANETTSSLCKCYSGEIRKIKYPLMHS